ncbi:MAG: T9SS type A sorting domain-containing protein, partial [Ignavibacteriales bacterium]|nr:T9SS type A sorting domain-containing protein [Ignavibacteriales bacterium]
VGKVQYRLKQIDFNGVFEYSPIVEVNVEAPSQLKLAQNYPNPFNPGTTINYQIPFASHVTLKVYDVLGREVATLVDEFKQAGNYNTQFSTLNSQLTSGIYFYKLQTDNGFSETKKLMIVK